MVIFTEQRDDGKFVTTGSYPGRSIGDTFEESQAKYWDQVNKNVAALNTSLKAQLGEDFPGLNIQ